MLQYFLNFDYYNNYINQNHFEGIQESQKNKKSVINNLFHKMLTIAIEQKMIIQFADQPKTEVVCPWHGVRTI